MPVTGTTCLNLPHGATKQQLGSTKGGRLHFWPSLAATGPRRTEKLKRRKALYPIDQMDTNTSDTPPNINNSSLTSGNRIGYSCTMQAFLIGVAGTSAVSVVVGLWTGGLVEPPSHDRIVYGVRCCSSSGSGRSMLSSAHTVATSAARRDQTNNAAGDHDAN